MERAAHRILLITLFHLLGGGLCAQTKKFTLSGYVRDGGSAEALPGAVIAPAGALAGAVTNAYGFYSLDLPAGDYVLSCSYLGYVTDSVNIRLNSNVTKDFKLKEIAETLDGATVRAVSNRERLFRPETGVLTVSKEISRKVPVIFGEKDIIKIIQMMPGVQAPSEGSTGFSVRGGGVDQNLILLDEAPVFNVGHLLGFFSVFNDNAVKSADLFKGDIAPKYGGRLSSLLDVHTLDGNMYRFGGTLDLGLISSKVFLEGPLVREKVSYMVAARRTYVDLFIPLFEQIKNDKMSFYDLNAKVNWNINENNRVYLSTFSGSDKFSMAEVEDMDFDMSYDNNAQSLRWNHVFSPKLFSNFTLTDSRYNFYTMLDAQATDIDFKSHIRSRSAKADFTWYLSNPGTTISFGTKVDDYHINPADLKAKEDGEEGVFVHPETDAKELAAYLQCEQTVGDALSVRYGLRYSYFEKEGKGGAAYSGLEPRLSASVRLCPNSSLKASYSRNRQYIQQAVYSISGSPLDLWFTASGNIEPQLSDQYTLGYYRDFLSDALAASVELFYKDNDNTIDFKDHPNIMMNEDMESELRTGRSYAYGAETMLKFNLGKFEGWASYTFSEAKYLIPELNGGKPYDSPKNHRHSVNLVTTYNINRRLALAADWVYYSGAPTTFPNSAYVVGETVIPYYSARNKDHFPDYHRLDLSLTLQNGRRPKGERWHSEWNFSLYNAYCQRNAWAIYFSYHADNAIYSKMTYLFLTIPSVSFSVDF